MVSKTEDSDNLPITRTNQRKIIGIGFFYYNFLVFGIYKVFDYQINTDNYIDIVSGIFYRDVVHANKKIENWTLWIIGDIIVTPLYAYRGLGCYRYNI
jgi:nicotinamide mononucleotide transporter